MHRVDPVFLDERSGARQHFPKYNSKRKDVATSINSLGINRAGISTDGQRLIHILNRAALEGLICYAARRGKQLTFALLDEWAPLGKTLTL